jgi:hypothetical protein
MVKEAAAPSRQYTFGTNFFSDVVTNMNAAPPVRVKVNRLHGRIRFALGLWAANATAPQIADILSSCACPRVCDSRAPVAALVQRGHGGEHDEPRRQRLHGATPGGHGDQRRGHGVPDAVTKNLGVTPYETTDDTRDGTGLGSATNDCDLRGTVAGAVVAVTQNLALYMAYVQD